MAIVGRVVTRPANTAPPIRHISWVEMRCLLCGRKNTHGLGELTYHPLVDLIPRSPMVVTFCDCYDDNHQEVRMIPDDREAGPLLQCSKVI
jgi:hypothetical protein